jgi:hypothetical protein
VQNKNSRDGRLARICNVAVDNDTIDACRQDRPRRRWTIRFGGGGYLNDVPRKLSKADDLVGD